jgi:hypothetical protein
VFARVRRQFTARSINTIRKTLVLTARLTHWPQTSQHSFQVRQFKNYPWIAVYCNSCGLHLSRQIGIAVNAALSIAMQNSLWCYQRCGQHLRRAVYKTWFVYERSCTVQHSADKSAVVHAIETWESQVTTFWDLLEASVKLHAPLALPPLHIE